MIVDGKDVELEQLLGTSRAILLTWTSTRAALHADLALALSARARTDAV